MQASARALDPFRLPTGELDFSRLAHHGHGYPWGVGREIACFTLSLVTLLLALWVQMG